MGYAICVSTCVCCRRVFSYNPNRVPSIRLNPETGQVDPSSPREPICETCITLANAEREKRGMDPWHVHPDAYGPVEESELV